jgi:8-oxo-dGTP pyrophosphatase MutT (NUDIX family)
MMRTAVAMADRPKIRVIAAAIVRDARVLLVRKSSGRTFMLPGGKPEPGESEPETLRREIHEELGCDIDNLERFGQFLDVAADQADHASASPCTSAPLSEPPPHPPRSPNFAGGHSP